MADGQWHIQWIREALVGMQDDYGEDHIKATQKRFMEADREVYRKTILEHGQRVGDLRLASR